MSLAALALGLVDRFDTASNIYAGGLGFRYLIARRFGLKVGIDAAISNDDHAIYLQVGSAWN